MAANKEARAMPQFTPLEAQVVEGVVAGKSQQRIAREMGCSSGHVGKTITRAAAKVPGGGRPSFRLYRWYWELAGGSTSAIDRAVKKDDSGDNG